MSIINGIKKKASKYLAMLLTASMVISPNVTTVIAADNADETALETEISVQGEEEAQEAAEEEIVIDEAESETVAEEVTGVEEEEITESTETDENESDEELSESIIEETAVKANADTAEEAAEAEAAVGAIYDTTLGLTNAKAVCAKKGKMQISWKKGKEDKSFRVFPILKNGDTSVTPLDGISGKTMASYTKKAKFEFYADELPENAADAFKIVGYSDTYGSSETGHYAYVVATPSIAQVQRHGDIAFGCGRLEISYTDVIGADNYTIQRSKKKNFKEVDETDVNFEVYRKDFYDTFNGASWLQRTVIDNCESLASDGKTTYFYRVSAEKYIKDLDKKISSPVYSAAVGSKVTVRAPREGSISENDATSVNLSWEDMTAETIVTVLDGDQVVERYDTTDQITVNDTYIIYASINGGKFKKIKTIKANDEDLEYVNIGAKAWNGADVFPYKTVSYELTGLKAEKDYVFKIAAVKNNLTGAKSNGDVLALHTELNDVDGMTFKNSNMDWIQVSWNKVPGATGFRVYYRELESEAIAKSGVENWNMSAASYIDVPNKVKDDKVIATIPELQNRRYYGIQVVALGDMGNKKLENPQKSKASINYIAAMTKISAPDVKVKQSFKEKDHSVTLKFSWDAVKKATGYRIEYVVAGDDVENPVRVRDYKVKEVDSDDLSFEIDGLYIGEPVTVKVTTMYDKDATKPEDKYGNACVLYESVRPENPRMIDTIYTREDTGATIYIRKPVKTYENSTYVTEYFYQVYKSDKKNKDKDYEIISISANNTMDPYNYGTGYDTVTDYTDLANGKTRHYRVYLVAHTRSTTYDFDNYAISRSYDYDDFCKATSVKGSTISVEEGKSKTIELNFSPSATTVKEVKEWYVATGDSKVYDTELAVKPSGKIDASNNSNNRFKNKYIEVKDLGCYWRKSSNKDGGYCYNEILGNGLLGPKLKIEGVKKGTTYVKAVLSSGEEVTVKIKVTEKQEDDDDDDDKDDDKTIICLDPGHGGSDGGCASGNLKESTINLKISKYTKSYLEKYGYEVHLTRSSDSAVDLRERVKYAKRKNAVAIVSQHINSGSGTGLECYYSAHYKSSDGKKLAQNMLNETKDETGMNVRGAKTKEGDNGDYYAIIRYAASSASNDGGKSIIGVIMENGFIQNDASHMDSDSDLEKIAKGNAKGIKKTF